MDIYDPQTLGIVVFGGFMVFSAIGIVMVSTFSMKETSYEDAIAKQRKELGKTQSSQRTDKKKKDKAAEKKTRGKKREDKPNGKLSGSEASPDVTDMPAEPNPPTPPAPEQVAALAPKPDTPSQKMVEPASSQKFSPTLAQKSSPAAPAQKSSSTAPAQKSSSTAPAQKSSSTAPAQKCSPSTPGQKSSSGDVTQNAIPSASNQKPSPANPDPPHKAAAAPEDAPPAPSPKNKKKKKVKVDSASAEVLPKTVAPLETSTRNVPVMAVPPVGALKAEEPKHEPSLKKKGRTKKAEQDSPLCLPYKTLVSTVRSMVFSEGQAQQLMEILSDKCGLIQDTWHRATQKGDPVALLKKHLEEREKQLTAEQDDAAAAKSRLRELNKELSVKKSKMASVETRLSSQLSKREQDIVALQARMQASYQDHLTETQQLNAKVLALQEQLGKGPNAQLVRLEQENSVLRDALNQATSEMESKQNAELAKLRQDCVQLNKELREKTEALQAEEQHKNTLESKAASAEEQLAHLQTLTAELQHANNSLKEKESRASTLEEELTQLNNTTTNQVEVTAGLQCLQNSIKEKDDQIANLLEELQQVKQQTSDHDRFENTEMVEQLKIRLKEKETRVLLLEEEMRRNVEQNNTCLADLTAKLESLHNSVIEKDSLVTSLQQEVQKLKELHQTQSYESLKDVLKSFQHETKEVLHSLFPQIQIDAEQSSWLQDFTSKAQEMLNQTQQSKESQQSTELLEVMGKLQAAQQRQCTLQAECQQYRSVLTETEEMLKTLQKSVEQQEKVWRTKIMKSEEQLRVALQTVQELEDTAESLRTENQDSQQLKQRLSESERRLSAAQKQLHTQRKELSQVRQHLSDVRNGAQGLAENGQPEAEECQVQAELQQTLEKLQSEQALSQQLSAEVEQAQENFRRQLETHVELMRSAEDTASIEDIVMLKECLDKERKMTKDLGQAATKLQHLLRNSQDRLAKEREKVRTLEEQLQEQGAGAELKEGSSVKGGRH